MKRAIFWVMGVWVCVFSCVQLFADPWTVARQAPLFMEFSRRLAVEWLGLQASNEWGVSLIPGQGTNIPQVL